MTFVQRDKNNKIKLIKIKTEKKRQEKSHTAGQFILLGSCNIIAKREAR